MASRYASNLASETLTDITGGGADAGTYLLNLCNRDGANERTVRVAVTSGAAPTDADWIEYDTTVEPRGVLSRWPIPLAQGWRVYVRASGASVSAHLIGRKEG